ncbi:MAG: STAS domain-containing protein [Pseudomonadota bacterium]
MSSAASIDYQADSLQVSGALNFVTVVALWRESLAKLPAYNALHFDMAKVSDCNSAGLALMLEWLKYAKRNNKKIIFNNIPANLASIIKVAGINQIVNI